MSGLVLFSDRPTYLRSTYNNQTPLYPIAKATPTTYPYLGTLPGLALPCLGPIKSPSSPKQNEQSLQPNCVCAKETKKENHSAAASSCRPARQSPYRQPNHCAKRATESPRHLTPQSIADQPRHFCLRQLFIGHGSGVHGRQPERPALGAAHPLLTSGCPSWHVMIVSTSCASSTTTTLLAISSLPAPTAPGCPRNRIHAAASGSE